MPSTTPIRRYVIVRRRGHGTGASTWSKERVAPASASAAPASAVTPRPAVPAGRA